jgi:hypothetical protein
LNRIWKETGIFQKGKCSYKRRSYTLSNYKILLEFY